MEADSKDIGEQLENALNGKRRTRAKPIQSDPQTKINRINPTELAQLINETAAKKQERHNDLVNLISSVKQAIIANKLPQAAVMRLINDKYKINVSRAAFSKAYRAAMK